VTDRRLDDTEDPYERVDALLRLGKFAEAIRILNIALASDPQDADLLNQLAWAHRESDDPTEAVKAAERAIAADPEFGRPYRALAWARWDLGNSRAALEAARMATRLDPEDAQSWAAIAFMAGAMGLLEEADSARREATRLEPEAPYVWLGAGSFAQGDEESAAQRRALELAPEDCMANNNYGYGLMRRGQFSDAIPYLERALIADPGSVRPLANLATALSRSGRVEEGQRIRRRLYESALQKADEALAKDPHDVRAIRRRANMLLAQNRRSNHEARELARRACELDPENPSSWSLRAQAEMSVGDLDEALRAAESGLRIEPDVPQPLEQLADVAALSGRADAARACADELVARFPGTLEALAGAAAAALAEGDYGSAQTIYTELLQLRATDCCTNVLLALTLLRAGKLEAAHRSLEDAQLTRPGCTKIAVVEREFDAARND
jgi:tetratricopeptide (TPR) repeat protein